MSLKFLSISNFQPVPIHCYIIAALQVGGGGCFLFDAIMYLHFEGFSIRWQFLMHSSIAPMSLCRSLLASG